MIKLKQILSEDKRTTYWKQYHSAGGKELKAEVELSSKSSKELAKLLADRVEKWNDENEDGKSNIVSKSKSLQIYKTAENFFAKEGWISEDIIDAMIMQS